MQLKTEVKETELVVLRQEARYWKAQHARAIEREIILKARIKELESRVQELSAQVEEVEELKARIRQLEHQLFGCKSERRVKSDGEEQKAIDGEVVEDGEESRVGLFRKRGKQPGQPGYGRRRRLELPKEEILCELPPEQQQCPRCGKPFKPFEGTEDSEQIEWEVRIYRKVYKRARYKPTCECGVVPGIVRAPVVAKVIPKGMFTTGFWARLIIEKYYHQVPLSRIQQKLKMEGLNVSTGTFTGGLQRLSGLLEPLYEGILERMRESKHWHIDETSWMIFVEREGKTGHKWWLWVSITKETICYWIDPSRSSSVPAGYLGEDVEGIVSADRYSAYKALARQNVNLKIAYCWGHVRRDFDQIIKGYHKLGDWGESWLKWIGEIYRLNDERLKVVQGGEEFLKRNCALVEELDRMSHQRDKELSETNLHPAQRKVLESLVEHWSGLLIFVEHPEVPMDNNMAERGLRNPVVGRKNYYGNGSIWGGRLCAILFTIIQTYLLHNLNPRLFLQRYFEVCAENGGKAPEDSNVYLPWNLSEEQRKSFQLKRGRSP